MIDLSRSWLSQALCTVDDQDLFLPPTLKPLGYTSQETQAAWARAKEICAICPVMHQCRRDTLGERDGVFGGLDPRERDAVRRALPASAKRWPAKRRLELGKAIFLLRQVPAEETRPFKSWRAIDYMTGIPEVLARELMADYEADIAKRERAKTRALPVVAKARRMPPWPDTNGRKDAWVRHDGRMSDASYAGETQDGAWLRFQLRSGRGNSFKWVPAGDVRWHTAFPDSRRYVVPRKEKRASRAA